MELIALAIAPGIAICLFIFHRDAYNKEPKLPLLICFALGALTVFPAAIIEGKLMTNIDNSFLGTAISTFLIIALTEEMCKFVVLRYVAFPLKSFDEPLDGIVYAVMVSMGFATLENIFYVEKHGLQVALFRMFLAVPGHATFGVLMGYHVGKAKFDPVNRTNLLVRGVFWAVVAHGFYDFFLLLNDSPDVAPYVSGGLLFLGAVTSLIVALRLSFKQIKLHRVLSQQTYRPTETMSLRRAVAKDIPLLRDLANAIWPSTYQAILSKEQIDYMMNMMYSEQALKDDLQKGNEFVILYDSKTPIGFASYGLTAPQVFKLHKIYVHSSQQGRGAGKFIIDSLSAAMKAKGAGSIQLTVNRNNPAKGFYEKIGFVVIEEVKLDIGSGFVMDDFVMEKKLS